MYDNAGQLLTGSFMDYALPKARLMPAIETLRTETPSPHNPLGVKGVGETGTIAATPAVVNAVMDALCPSASTTSTCRLHRTRSGTPCGMPARGWAQGRASDDPRDF